jgi:hypothetical protein
MLGSRLLELPTGNGSSSVGRRLRSKRARPSVIPKPLADKCVLGVNYPDRCTSTILAGRKRGMNWMFGSFSVPFAQSGHARTARRAGGSSLRSFPG